jgi:hypothetical protein
VDGVGLPPDLERFVAKVIAVTTTEYFPPFFPQPAQWSKNAANILKLLASRTRFELVLPP